MSLENSTEKLYDDNEQEESEQEIGENENESSIDVHSSNTKEMMRIPEITTEELRTAINKLKKGKSPDSNGIRAEDIKACDDETREMGETNLQRDHNAERIHAGRLEESDDKSDTQGDVENVGNYRPICSLPALYKLFSIMLYSSFCPRLDQIQAEDQAGIQRLIPDNRPLGDVQND